MQRILKFQLSISPGVYPIFVPGYADVLSVQVQNGQPVLYALVEADELPSGPLEIICALTGDYVDDALTMHNYIGTAMLAGDNYVVHYFQKV